MNAFSQVAIEVDEGVIKIKMKSQSDNEREYERALRFDADNNVQILAKIRTYFENLQKVDSKITRPIYDRIIE